MTPSLDLPAIREQFPALAKTHETNPVVHFDGPAGSQVPIRVAGAVADTLLDCNANDGGHFTTSRRVAALMADINGVFDAFFGARDPGCIVTGPSMTALTFTAAQSIASTWSAGDEILVTDLEHDANVSPWIQAAEDAGVTVRQVPFSIPDTLLDLGQLDALLTPKTKLVAVSMASNVTGTKNPISEISARAHAVGALVYVDAVHYAPHGPIDVEALGCDFLVCSAYKFFGPHVSMLWGRRALMETLPTRKVRPASDGLPTRWVQGTPPFETLAGAAEGIRYMAGLVPPEQGDDLRTSLLRSFEAIMAHEKAVFLHLLRGLRALPGVTIWGVTDPDRYHERVPTVSFTSVRKSPDELARVLASEGICVWSGHHYGIPVTDRLGITETGTLRIGLLHYNTVEEVERCLGVLQQVLGGED